MFENTKKALEEFQKNIVCNNCRTPKKELQYLGSDCKHAFCWDCIGTFNQKAPGRRSVTRSQCPTCSYPLNTNKIVGANMLNICFQTLSDLRELLEQAAEITMTQADIASTQHVFDKAETREQYNHAAVEKFLETQSHMPDELGQPEDESTEIKRENRENSYSPELDLFHDYSEKSTERSAVKRPSSSTESGRKPKRSTVLKTVKNEMNDGPIFGLFDSQIPQRTHENDLLTPFVRRRSTAPPSSSIGKYAQPFGSTDKDEEDPFTRTIPLPKRQASLQNAQLATKAPKKEEPDDEVFEEVPSTSSRSRKNSIKFEERRSQSPMSFGEKSMALKPEQRRSSYGTRRGEVVIINSILNNRIPQLKSAVEAGTCINERDNYGKTPLFVAVEQNSLEAVKILVEAGAVINAACGPTLETTLHEAVRRGNRSMVEYLLSKGASVKLRNAYGKTVEDLAKSDSKMNKLIEKCKQEQRTLQPVILPPKSRIHFVSLIDEKMITEAEKRKLPGKINLVNMDMDTPTHLVVKVDPKSRVLNISKDQLGEVLKAIIRPGLVVSREWLKACIADPKKVDEDHLYTVQKVQWIESEIYENKIDLWKKAITKMQPRLFAGCKFYIPKPKYNFLDRTVLMEIVRLAGGHASARDTMINEKDPAPYYNTSLKPNFVIYSLTHDIGEKFRDCTKYTLVSEQWLIDAILSCSINRPPH